jgi:hypothetical protein
MAKLGFFKAWVMFLIVGTIGGVAAGFVAGAVLGAIMGLAGAEMESIRRGGQIIGFLAALPVSYYVYKWSIEKYVLTSLGVVDGERQHVTLPEA